MFGYIHDSKQQNIHGIGLGLNISKQIVEQFGGKIEMKSVEGLGSIFKFTLNLKYKKEKNHQQSGQKMQEIQFYPDVDKFVFFWTPKVLILPIKYIYEKDDENVIEENQEIE